MALFNFQKPDKVIMIDSTDFEGKFYTYVTKPFLGQNGIVELLPPGRMPATFEWSSTTSWEGDIPCFYRFNLEPELAEVIREGLPGTSMPAWKYNLADEEIDDIIAWLLGSVKEPTYQ